MTSALRRVFWTFRNILKTQDRFQHTNNTSLLGEKVSKRDLSMLQFLTCYVRICLLFQPSSSRSSFSGLPGGVGGGGKDVAGGLDARDGVVRDDVPAVNIELARSINPLRVSKIQEESAEGGAVTGLPNNQSYSVDLLQKIIDFAWRANQYYTPMSRNLFSQLQRNKDEVCRDRRLGPRTPSDVNEADLDCGL